MRGRPIKTKPGGEKKRRDLKSVLRSHPIMLSDSTGKRIQKDGRREGHVEFTNCIRSAGVVTMTPGVSVDSVMWGTRAFSSTCDEIDPYHNLFSSSFFFTVTCNLIESRTLSVRWRFCCFVFFFFFHFTRVFDDLDASAWQCNSMTEE